MQRARVQWAPNRATARAAAKCATRRNGGGNTPTDRDRLRYRRRCAPQKNVSAAAGPVRFSKAILRYYTIASLPDKKTVHHVNEAGADRTRTWEKKYNIRKIKKKSTDPTPRRLVRSARGECEPQSPMMLTIHLDELLSNCWAIPDGRLL